MPMQTRRAFLGRSAALTGALLGSRLLGPGGAAAAPATGLPASVSGVFPSLAMFNDEQECGTGAIVVWAVTAGTPSDAFLFDGGFERRLLHLAHGADHDGDLELVRVEDPASDRWHRDNVPIPTGVMEVDDRTRT